LSCTSLDPKIFSKNLLFSVMKPIKRTTKAAETVKLVIFLETFLTVYCMVDMNYIYPEELLGDLKMPAELKWISPIRGVSRTQGVER
jgi:hypothetical protein